MVGRVARDKRPIEAPPRSAGAVPVTNPQRVAKDWSHLRELNPGPTVYETVALPLS
jgi:hypothetical protein